MDIAVTVALVSGGIALATYGLGWLNGRKKNIADIEGQKLKNVQGYIEIYEKYQNELKNQLDVVTNKVIELTTQMQRSSRENSDLVGDIFTLSGEMAGLKKENILLLEEMQSLRKENAELKNQISVLNERLQRNGR